MLERLTDGRGIIANTALCIAVVQMENRPNPEEEVALSVFL